MYVICDLWMNSTIHRFNTAEFATCILYPQRCLLCKKNGFCLSQDLHLLILPSSGSEARTRDGIGEIVEVGTVPVWRKIDQSNGSGDGFIDRVNRKSSSSIESDCEESEFVDRKDICVTDEEIHTEGEVIPLCHYLSVSSHIPSVDR